MRVAEAHEARIGVVDDQQPNVDLLTALLAGCGYTKVVATTDSSQAIELCRRHDPNLKRAWPVECAVEEIESQAGAQFCPTVVRAFSELDHECLVAPFDARRRFA